jgi:hypothetical protein
MIFTFIRTVDQSKGEEGEKEKKKHALSVLAGPLGLAKS